MYVAFLQSLAFVRDQQGDAEGAESLYRKAIGSPKPDLSGVVLPIFSLGKLPMPFVGEPRSALAAVYLNHKRFEEAEALYRERLADRSLTTEDKLSTMEALVSLLSIHGDPSGAMALKRQVIALVQQQPDAGPEWRDRIAQQRYSLGNLEVDAGKGDEARELLETDLRQAEAQHGRNSSEYGEVLNYFYENRSHAQDYSVAEKLAREEVERAETSGASEGIELVTAMFRLADVLRAEGKSAEADELQKRAIAMNVEQSKQPRSAKKFEEAEELVRAGKPGEAVRLAREIAEDSSAPEAWDEHFGFRHLAQLLVGEHKAEAAKVTSIALATDERQRGDSPRIVFDLTDWAGFYRGFLSDTEKAAGLLTRAEALVHACCGLDSPQMEPVLEERAWLAGAVNGPRASIDYLEQLRRLRVSIYGEKSEPVTRTDRDLALIREQTGNAEAAPTTP